MSRPPTMSQLLKRAGLAKRPRIDPSSKQKTKKARPNPNPKASGNGTAAVDGSREDGTCAGKGADEATAGGAVDEQIAALERELNGGDGSSSDEESGSSSSSGSEDDDMSREGSGEPTKLVSPLEAEKIEPLPAHLLPRPGCGVPKVVKKKKPKIARADASTTAAAGSGPSRSQGLDSAVKELLANYEARSSERVPFYCRVCQFQGDSLEALQKHKEEPLHLEATKKERKISTCSLCKKQFTSPPQLKEHLAGKAHLERLQAVMSRQGKWMQGGRGGGGRGRGERGERVKDGFSIRENGGEHSQSGSATGWGRGRGGRERGRGGNDGGRGQWRGGRVGRGRGPGRGHEGAT